MDRASTRLNPRILGIVKQYDRYLQSAGIPVENLIVFGSHAKGAAHPDSDIDVAVISSSFGQNRFDEMVRLAHLRHGLYEIEAHPLHPNDFNDRWDSFAHEVKKYGIPV